MSRAPLVWGHSRTLAQAKLTPPERGSVVRDCEHGHPLTHAPDTPADVESCAGVTHGFALRRPVEVRPQQRHCRRGVRSQRSSRLQPGPWRRGHRVDMQRWRGCRSKLSCKNEASNQQDDRSYHQHKLTCKPMRYPRRPEAAPGEVMVVRDARHTRKTAGHRVSFRASPYGAAG